METYKLNISQKISDKINLERTIRLHIEKVKDLIRKAEIKKLESTSK